MVNWTSDRLFNALMYVTLLLVSIAAIFPMLYVVSVSITPYTELLRNGGFIVIPRSVTFTAYRELFHQPYILSAFNITVFITVVGTAINLILTTLMAFPLSRKDLPGRNIVLMMVVLTLLFSGGIIPTYLIVKDTGLLDSVWSMIIPNAIWSFNVLIMKSFFENLPEEIMESARMDGSSEYGLLIKIVVPLSVPVMFTLGLFYLVGHWNEFYHAIMYVTKPDIQPLQVVIRNMLMQAHSQVESVDETIPTMTLQMAAVVYASLPIIVFYPFIQKHFSKGIIIGAIKG
ncbi:carbohydrate ABC transporter permease [Paenibacillus sp. FSL H8-0034]|uniref:carbohydrate ABC transporter permease n=1 Tax=Paenibacillus sp. FSL H8-0034 TaxID=2954671 RepID=UPI004046A56D